MTRFQLIGILVILLEAKRNSGQSLARMKKVTMSSEHGNKVGSNAVDGIYNRHSGSCKTDCCVAINVTTEDVNPWLEIDLGKQNTFTRIVLYGWTDANSTQQSCKSLSLYLDSSSVASTCIYNTEEPTHSFYHFKLGRSYSARYIKLQLRGFDKTLLLCEVDVFNDAIISKGKVTSSSSTYSDWMSALAVDGFISTHDLDACRCCAGTVKETDPWITVDLGDTFLVTFIQMHGSTDQDYDGQPFDGMKIQLDGTDIYTVPNGKVLKYFEMLPVPEKIGRLVKFILVGSYRTLVICEVVVYGERVISIRKQASISTVYTDWDASRAVDGDFRTLPGLNCCTASEYQKDPYLRIHFGNAHRVTRIAIYGRTDGKFRNQHFEGMLIGSTNAFTRKVTAQEPGQWIDFFTFQLSTTALVSEINVTLPGANQQLVVCELIVYGDCSDGYFGQGCSRQCHCEGLTCDTITGVCPSRICKPGYIGLNCSEDCQVSWYGQDCSEKCGHCKCGQKCNHISGDCSECQEGYYSTDALCKADCSDGYFGKGCSRQCHCEGLTCDTITGVCPSRICKPGYIGLNCNDRCQVSWYGLDCSEQCGHCKGGQGCNHITGYCSECEEGYYSTDALCKTDCSGGYFGQGCSRHCHCEGLTCDTITGVCPSRICKAGYIGMTCSEECQTGTFGFNCEHRCGMCTGGDVCDIYTGVCQNGCSDGYKGYQCLQKMNQETTVSLSVFIGSLSGVTFVFTLIIILLACLLYRTRLNMETHQSAKCRYTPIALPNDDAKQLDNTVEESVYLEID